MKTLRCRCGRPAAVFYHGPRCGRCAVRQQTKDSRRPLTGGNGATGQDVGYRAGSSTALILAGSKEPIPRDPGELERPDPLSFDDFAELLERDRGWVELLDDRAEVW